MPGCTHERATPVSVHCGGSAASAAITSCENHNAPRTVMDMAASKRVQRIAPDVRELRDQEKAQIDPELLAARADPGTSWGEEVDLHRSKADARSALAACLSRAPSSSGSAARRKPVDR